MLSRKKKIYEGKAKILYEGTEAGTIIQYFKDDATAFNNQKQGEIKGKGVLNNRISEFLYKCLGEMGIPTHFMKRINMREQLIKNLEIIPIEVVIRNVAAGSLCKRLGLDEGEPLSRPLIEFYYKDDELGDPMISEEHIHAFSWANPQELDDIIAYSFRINDILSGIFSAVGIKLVDFKLEFGRSFESEEPRIVLGDEISPDTCRLWDRDTNEKMDKDRFRQDLGKVSEAYQEVAKRLRIMPDAAPVEVITAKRAHLKSVE